MCLQGLTGLRAIPVMLLVCLELVTKMATRALVPYVPNANVRPLGTVKGGLSSALTQHAAHGIQAGKTIVRSRWGGGKGAARVRLGIISSPLPGSAPG